ncbi:MAG: bifunctional diguanylate cyclase/phosphodiesterase [Deltaproteobacteria bacterium]|nr:bifunctional diguanylate cyclase/phosphodiesterase [Deltaproteobacteria bacterium]
MTLKLPRFFRRLDKFILCIAVSTSVAIAVISAYLLYNFGNKIINAGATTTSSYIAGQTFNTMYQIMKRGWNEKQVEGFIGALKKSSKNEKMVGVYLFRGAIVKKQFGRVPQPKENSVVKKAFETKSVIHKTLNGKEIYAYPLLAKSMCLRCHTMAKAGDVNGVIEVSFNTANLTNKFKGYYFFILFLIFILPISGGVFVTFILRRSIKHGIESINKEVENIKTVKDLKSLDTKLIDLKFEEFNQIYKGVGGLSARLRDIAVDKDVLEFEIKLLERFIITSEVVKDWKEHVFNLLIEMNNIIKVYNVFSIFIQDENSIEIEVFWKGEPTEKTKKLFDKLIYQSIYHNGLNSFFVRGIGNHEIFHNIADKSSMLPELSEEDLSVQTKKVILDTPHIGGIVGIGIQAEESIDTVRELVISSVLTTLLNVIGSIKAIYKYTKELEYYATRDGLTSLYNQRVFMEFLHYEVERSKRNGNTFGLVFIDFDNFKLINDMYGHNFGDKFLKAIADILEKEKRSEDILARYGGDEFVMILPGAKEEQAYMISNKIRESIKKFSLTDPNTQKSVGATVSIGIAVYPYSASDEKDLFLLADNMMYKAKKMGKDTVYVAKEEDAISVYKEVSEKSKMVLNALEQDIILPYFQPIIDLKTGGVIAHELLMRIKLDSIKGGLPSVISAGEFIEIAENIGVAHKLDLMLLEKAFQKIKEEGYKNDMFINLSPKSLIVTDYVKTVKHLSLKYNIDTSKIVFELTERETVKNITLLEKFVVNLKYEGFRFAVDDFGSGFSSFLYIKRFPIDFLKIDGEFIRGIFEDKMDRAVVVSSISIAKEMGIKTIAEFIESEEVLSELKKLSVDYAQGFFIGIPAENFSKK